MESQHHFSPGRMLHECARNAYDSMDHDDDRPRRSWEELDPSFKAWYEGTAERFARELLALEVQDAEGNVIPRNNRERHFLTLYRLAMGQVARLQAAIIELV